MKLTKKITLLVIAVAILWIPSCTKNQKQENNQDTTTETLKTKKEQTYLFAHDRDTILLTLNNDGDTISGKLDILYYEKDSRRGTILSGQQRGDTLFAIYDSMQEGQQSQCEIALLKKDDSYILSNDILGKDNYQYNSDYTKGNFKNKSVIKFDGETLKKVN